MTSAELQQQDMNDFPMFALKPYAECVGDRVFYAQEMGQCRLSFNARSVENCEIVRYHQNQDESVHDNSKIVQFLGMRRSDDILFYCADTSKMTVSVSGDSAVTFQNKPLEMKPGVFKLTGCSTRLMAWARTFDMCHSVSQSPQTETAVRRSAEAAGRRTASTFSVFSPPPAATQSASHVNTDDSDSHDDDDEILDGERRNYTNFEVLQTDPKDAALFPWLIRVKVISTNEIGFMCSVCWHHEQGAWSTTPCLSQKIQRKKRHALSAPHKKHEAGVVGAEQLSKVRSFQYNKAMTTLKQQFLIAEYIALNLLPLEQFTTMIALNKTLGTFGTESVALYESTPTGKEMMQCLAHAVRHEHHQRWLHCDVIGVTIDETTDKSIASQMIVCYKYFHAGVVYEECAALQQLPNGKSETVFAALLHALQRDEVPLSKVVFFGTDGASSMVGQRKGVHKRLSQLVPEVIGYHCALHRWSLACKHTCQSIPKMQYWFDNLEAAARHYCFSATRRFSLHQHQRENGLNEVVLVEACVTRWLTHDLLSKSVLYSLPAIITQLAEDVASDKADIQAIGFLNFFFAEDTLYYLMVIRDVVPVLAHFSLIMQGVQVDYVDLQRQLHNAKSKIEKFMASPGANVLAFEELRSQVQQLLPTRRMKSTPWHVLETTRLQYIMTLIANIDSYYPSLPVQDAFETVLSRAKFLEPLEAETVPTAAFRVLLMHYAHSHLKDVTTFMFNLEWSNFASFCKVHNADTKQAERNEIQVHIPLSTHDMLLLFMKLPQIEFQCPTICKIIRIYFCFTVTTATCERGFSVMKLIKNSLRTRLSNAFLEILIVLGHCKTNASDACINLAMNLFVNFKDRRYMSQLSGEESLATKVLCDQISTFVWGNSVTVLQIAAEVQRFSAAPGLDLANERFSGGAFSNKAVYSLALQQMKINAQSWGKCPEIPQTVPAAAAFHLQHAFDNVASKPASKRARPNSAASAAAPLPIVPPPLPLGVFGVENIVDIKVSGKHVMYLVKWVGYDTALNTWEPEVNILDPALLACFQQNHSSAHQAAMATIAKRKQPKEVSSSDLVEEQSPAEIQQQDRSTRGGRASVLPFRFQ
jgi:hypothetical protein